MMKTFLKISLGVSLLINSNIHAQYNTTNNTVGLPEKFSFPEKSSANATFDTATVVCSGVNSFWGFDQQTAELKEFDISNNVITYSGNSIATAPGYSLAICNNLNGGSISPTLYTSTGNQMFYWDGGSNWITGPPATAYLANACGNGNMLYFLDNSTSPTTILKYDGSNYTPFFSINKYSGLADLASDANGNTYLLTRTPGGLFISDSIVVVDTSGLIIQQYAFVIDVSHGYGCFITGNTLYLGFGSSNAVNPNSLVPVTFSGSNAIMGTAIPFPAGILVHNDLASCTPGLPLGIAPELNQLTISLFPNPATNILTLSLAEFSNTSYAILDLNGKILIPGSEIISKKTFIDVSALTNGIYFIEIKNEKGILRKKFCKI